MKFHAIIVIAK